jgi:hypothetical protein
MLSSGRYLIGNGMDSAEGMVRKSPKRIQMTDEQFFGVDFKSVKLKLTPHALARRRWHDYLGDTLLALETKLDNVMYPLHIHPHWISMRVYRPRKYAVRKVDYIHTPTKDYVITEQDYVFLVAHFFSEENADTVYDNLRVMSKDEGWWVIKSRSKRQVRRWFSRDFGDCMEALMNGSWNQEFLAMYQDEKINITNV